MGGVYLLQYISAGSEKKGGLNGGGSTQSAAHRKQVVKSKDAKKAKEMNK